ncbi:unnamed protein product [Linum trigynum]|uniref:Uncharacterized protein n=1 Tax=Linum trigynum TaxID=586398 RepID=A0AAV2D9V5_9ROSI
MKLSGIAGGTVGLLVALTEKEKKTKPIVSLTTLPPVNQTASAVSEEERQCPHISKFASKGIRVGKLQPCQDLPHQRK